VTAYPRRKRLSRDADVATRYRVYEVPGGLEVEELSFVEASRRRVFFDEVVLVTYHRYRPVAAIVVAAVFALLFAFCAAVLREPAGLRVAAGFAALGGLFGLVLVALLVNPYHAITVFGLRNRARIVRRLSGRRAREIYARLCREVEAAQRAARGRAPETAAEVS
jgi:hypothetical protein